MNNIIQSLPKATRTLLLINVAMFALTWLMPNIKQTLALHYFGSPLFMPHQTLTHIFMHANLTHILFNMYALVMFGGVLEKQLGTQKFCILYFFSAIGAFMLHLGIVHFQLTDVPMDVLNTLRTQGAEIIVSGKNYTDPYLGGLNAQFNGAMVGASGAIMGLLIAFAIYFPNTELQLLFIPFPIKAKYFMPIYMLIELFLGVSNFQWDNVAHFAHLGGAIFGGLLMFYWINQGDLKLRQRSR